VGPPPVTQRLTLLPDATPLRLRQQAARLRQAGSTDQQRLDALENWFRTNGFRYSRTNLPTGADALERFLFDTKSGHCEFFASGFALLARGAGLPARLVGGYYGGEYNELGGYYRVSEERAHVWVEIWINGAGWLRYDPSSLAVNADTALGEPRQRSLAMRLRLLLDSLDHSWNSAIIAYDFERQLQMASSAHSRLQTLRLRNLNGLPLLLGLLLAAAGLIWLVLRLRRRGLFGQENLGCCVASVCCWSATAPSPATMPLGLFDILSRTTNRQVHEFVSIYARSLYHQSPLTPADYRRLKQLLRYGFL